MCYLKLMMAVAVSALYGAQYGVQEARESCTDGCTGHKDALKRTGRAAQMGAQGTKRRVHLKVSWRALGAHVEASWRALGVLLEATWNHLEATWRPLGAQRPPRAAK